MGLVDGDGGLKPRSLLRKESSFSLSVRGPQSRAAGTRFVIAQTIPLKLTERENYSRLYLENRNP